MALYDGMAVSDLVWSIESGQELAINRIFWHQHHSTGNEFNWGTALQKFSDKVVEALLVPAGGTPAPRTYMSSTVALTRVDSYSLGSDGKAVDKATTVPEAGTQTGGMGGTAMPPQIGPIVQLWAYTGFTSHARRHRGRLYAPPAATSALQTNGRLSDSWRADALAAWTSFFNQCQGAHLNDGITGPTTDYAEMGVLSRADQAFYQLERVAIPEDVAVQRRRINKLTQPAPTFGTVSHS